MLLQRSWWQGARHTTLGEEVTEKSLLVRVNALCQRIAAHRVACQCIATHRMSCQVWDPHTHRRTVCPVQGIVHMAYR